MKLEIDNNKINELVRNGLKETIYMAKRAHYTNVKIRIDGQWVEMEADWIKYLDVTED